MQQNFRRRTLLPLVGSALFFGTRFGAEIPSPARAVREVTSRLGAD